MKKIKLLVALLLCFSMTMQAGATNYDSKINVAANSEENVEAESVFNKLKDTIKGSAICVNEGGKITIGDNVKFTENVCLVPEYKEEPPMNQMGTIYSEGTKDAEKTNTIVMGDNISFEDNVAGGGAAMYLYGKNDVTIGNNVTFIANTVRGSESESQVAPRSGGGAITLVNEYNGAFNGDINFTVGESSLFRENTAMFGGAICSRNEKITVTIDKDARFIKNKAIGSSGGAIFNGGTMEIKGSSLFDNNSSSGNGGGAIANDGTTKVGGTFSNNSTDRNGGAIRNRKSADLTVYAGSKFKDNTAEDNGGAISNLDNAVINKLENIEFVSNKAKGTNNSKEQGRGGAIFNDSDKELKIVNSSFEQNEAYYRGGALMVNKGTVNIEDSSFTDNKVTVTAADEAGFGGAVSLRQNSVVTVKNSDFKNNTATCQGGAIIQHMPSSGTESKLEISEGSYFYGNSAVAEGGAVWAGNITNISDSVFEKNGTTGEKFTKTWASDNYKKDNEGGGAIFVGSSSKTEIKNSEFIGNYSNTLGGAVATRSNASNDGKTALNIENSNFNGNTAKIYGGALATYIDVNIKDTNFKNNEAEEKGGAVWARQNLTVSAENKDVVFSGNKADEGADIYMETKDSTLNLNVAEGKTITFDGGISGNKEGYNIVVSEAEPASVSSVSSVAGFGSSSESVVIKSAVTNGAITVNTGSSLHLAEGSELKGTTVDMKSGTTLNTQDNRATEFKGITLADDVNLIVDVDLANGKADNFSDSSNNIGDVIIKDINTIGNTFDSSITMNLSDMLGIASSKIYVDSGLTEQEKTMLTPIRYLKVKVSSSGEIKYRPQGNSYKDFNPAVMAAPVAAQVGGYLTQLNSYNQAFMNMDMKMIKNTDGEKSEEDKGIWVRPYSTFEDVELKDGPKVSNTAYGAFFGADSRVYDIGKDYEAVFSIYAGYNGSKQEYADMDISQNGGTLGIAGMAYKDNFFAGLTLNAGISSGEMKAGQQYFKDGYSKDDISLFTAGIAGKAGYNFEFKEGKYVLQPSMLVSYSLISADDYTSAAGFKMKSNMLSAVQLEPGVKFISNLGNGWQPYAGVSAVCSLMDKTDFTAADDKLPELSVDTYMKYGIGTGKVLSSNCSGYIQAYFTGNGRSGADIQAGFKYSFGGSSK